jgi:hypothetical protein
MNLLSLVDPRLNNIYQIRQKLYYIKFKTWPRPGRAGSDSECPFFLWPHAHVCDVYHLRGSNHPFSCQLVNVLHVTESEVHAANNPVCLCYKQYFFSQQTIFFSHNKTANNTFNKANRAVRVRPYSKWHKREDAGNNQKRKDADSSGNRI